MTCEARDWYATATLCVTLIFPIHITTVISVSIAIAITQRYAAIFSITKRIHDPIRRIPHLLSAGQLHILRYVFMLTYRYNR